MVLKREPIQREAAMTYFVLVQQEVNVGGGFQYREQCADGNTLTTHLKGAVID